MGVRAAVIGTHTEPRPADPARTATAGMMRSDRPRKRSLRWDTMPATMNVSGSGPMFREPMRHLVSSREHVCYTLLNDSTHGGFL